MRMAIAPMSYYGMTETTGTVSSGRYRMGASGKVASFCQVKIVDGEIWVKGNYVMKGYFREPQKTAEVLRDGWLRTGDLGGLDTDGYLYVKGRRKNTIVLPNGENISPEELEACLYELPWITECMIYGKDNKIHVDIFSKERLENAKAVEAQIRAGIEKQNHHLSVTQRIKEIHFKEQELPKNPMGKFIRKNP